MQFLAASALKCEDLSPLPKPQFSLGRPPPRRDWWGGGLCLHVAKDALEYPAGHIDGILWVGADWLPQLWLRKT